MLAAVGPAAGQESPESPPCDGFQIVPGQGPSCPVLGGWEVILRDGSRVLTHGPDAPPSEGLPPPLVVNGPSGPPACATGASGEGHGRAVYAVPFDKTDRWAGMQHEIRRMVNTTNSLLRQEASEFGRTMSYRMLCDADGLVEVIHAVLPTASASTSFSTIVSDLREMGHTHPDAKYWVWYDGSMSGIGGQGFVHRDSRLIASNANNVGNDFGITYGYTGSVGAKIMMHENGHNNGAVQPDAPYQSGGFHCNDGLDVMCYADGGSNSSYTSDRCGGFERWDCGKDSYFNPAPATGTYLATHWNIASHLNRFLSFDDGAPFLRYVNCAPNPVASGARATCSFMAEDDSAGVSYLVDFGDGETLRLPENGTIVPGEAQVARHVWADEGEYDVRVRVEDTAQPPHVVESVVRVRVHCTYTATNTLVVGLLGMERDGTSSRHHEGIGAACWGRAFTLTGSSPLEPVLGNVAADFDLCWTDGEGAVLRCDANEGDESGVVPEGATGATVVFRTGLTGFYRLQVS